ncbi:MAG: MBL fold metallo-hydrolase [Gammaproteobacteria bacterium]|nr:MBL fold metallo-hydrolase [Gammaproteobacteria bacterium]
MLKAGTLLPATALIGASGASHAAAAAAPPNSMVNTAKLGDFEITTLLAGSRVAEEPQTIFGMNVSAEEFATVSEANLIPTDKTRFYFNPSVVRAGSDVVLFDTGLNQTGILGALEQAGLTADDITVVVITHMHGDHIGGLVGEDGSATFPNARLITGQAEFDAWSKTDNERFAKIIKPMADKFDFIGDGASVVSGITSLAAYGHTPGHMIYMLESQGKQLVIAADTANHYVWSLAYPDWEVKFDMDKTAAAATRRNVFGMLAADKIPFLGYHMPFPGVGFVAPRENGFQYVPVSYQLALEQ